METKAEGEMIREESPPRPPSVTKTVSRRQKAMRGSWLMHFVQTKHHRISINLVSNASNDQIFQNQSAGNKKMCQLHFIID